MISCKRNDIDKKTKLVAEIAEKVPKGMHQTSGICVLDKYTKLLMEEGWRQGCAKLFI